jgi:hypothetical protein
MEGGRRRSRAGCAALDLDDDMSCRAFAAVSERVERVRSEREDVELAILSFGLCPFHSTLALTLLARFEHLHRQDTHTD